MISLPRSPEGWEQGRSVATSSAAVFGRSMALQVRKSRPNNDAAVALHSFPRVPPVDIENPSTVRN